MMTRVSSSRLITRRGMARGSLSRPFHVADVLRALAELTSAAPTDSQLVFVELDGEGKMTVGAEDVEGAGGAAVAARGVLAPHVAARTATVELEPHSMGALRVRLDCDLGPNREIALWFHDEVLALLGMPFLALTNIRGRDEYWCHSCETRFESPNPLKVHLFLRCAPFCPLAFWREVGVRLAGPAAPASAPDPDPARLEALATEWGRAPGGHLCLYCGKMYSRKYGLKIHIRTHTGYRPLRCRFCLRAFGDPSNLNKHVRLHAAAGEARACAACGKVVARRRDLERHLRTHALHT